MSDVVDDVPIDRPSTSQRAEVKSKRRERKTFNTKKYKCKEPYCKYSTAYKGILTKHKRNHKIYQGNKYKCDKPNCGFSSNIKQKLIRHVVAHSEERPHKCDKCEKGFKTKDDLKKHLKLHTEETSFQCEKCERAFKTKNYLKKHKVTHENGPRVTIRRKSRPVICKLCGFTIKNKHNLNHHILCKHTILEHLRCDYPDCQYMTRLPRYLSKHKSNAHALEKPFKCGKCDRSFRQQGDWKRHCFTHKRNKPFKCDKCQYSCTGNTILQLHTHHRHDNEKEYKCKICGDSYHLKKDLNKHKLNHSNAAKKFKCHMCPYRGLRHTYLLNHIRAHENKGRFKCDKCDRSFCRGSLLRVHQLIHSNVKKFKCNQCDYGSNNPDYLKRHIFIKSHFGSKANIGEKCDKCGLTLRDQSDAMTHRDVHRPCFVPLRRVTASRNVTTMRVQSHLLIPLQIELDEDIKIFPAHPDTSCVSLPVSSDVIAGINDPLVIPLEIELNEIKKEIC